MPTEYVTWISLLLLNLAWVCNSYRLFAAFQAALAIALMVFVDHRLETQPWYSSPDPDWLHPISLQWQGIALAGYGIVWSCLRLASSHRLQAAQTVNGTSSDTWLSTVLRPDWVHVDRLAVVAALVLMGLLTIQAVVPGVAQELSPVVGQSRVVPPAEEFQLLGLPHEPARGPLTWVLCGVVMFAFLLSLRERPGFDGLTGLTVAASAMPLLAAACWEPQVAVASALRWTSAVFFLLGSVLVWLRRPLERYARAWGIVLPRGNNTAGFSFSLLLLLATLPVLAMALFVALAALSLTPPTGAQLELMWWLTLLVAAVLVSSLVGSRLMPGWTQSSSVAASSSGDSGDHASVRHDRFCPGTGIVGAPGRGARVDGVFRRIGLAPSYAVPMMILSLALIGHAISFRSEPLAFAAGLLLNFSATAAYLLGFACLGGVDYRAVGPIGCN